VDVFSYPSLAQVDTVSAHVGSIYAIAGDKAGKHMAIGGEDGLVSIWDLEEMICLRTITEHE
jgi:THO complex subunit 3